MIPRILHRIWIGSRMMPAPFEAYWRRWATLNPGWELLTWSESPVLRNAREYRRVRTLAGKADILRYELLWNYGGVYVDCDEEPLRPLEELDLGGKDAFAGYESADWIANGVMGATAWHPAVEAVIAALPASVRMHGLTQPVHATGPGLLTRVWAGRDDVTLLPPVTFYPVHWTDKATLGGPYPPDAFGVQHWAHSWA